jgi:hypothetical protein
VQHRPCRTSVKKYLEIGLFGLRKCKNCADLRWFITVWSARNSKLKGARGSVVVKALCYKPEGRGFDTR